MNEILREILSVIRPMLELLVSIAGPILIGWIVAKISGALNIKSDKDKAEFEKLLRDALHSSAQNAWLFALKKMNISFTDLKDLAPKDLVEVMNQAETYVRDKNPDALSGLKVSREQLRDILLTKLPSVIRQ